MDGGSMPNSPIGILVVSIVIVLIIFFLGYNLTIFFKYQTIDSNGRKMIKLAKTLGPHLVVNTRKGVTAVCRYDSFQQSVNNWLHGARNETDEKKRLEWQVTKVQVFGSPTFTFSDLEDRLLVHTGTNDDISAIFEELVFLVTGFKRAKVGEKDFLKAANYLVLYDKRLSVPFLGNLVGGLRMEKQIELFGNKTVVEARKNLLPHNLL